MTGTFVNLFGLPRRESSYEFLLNDSTEKVAVKIIDRSRIESKFEKMLSREVATMDSVNHPHIIRYGLLNSNSI